MSNYGKGTVFEVLTDDGKHYTPKKWRIQVSYVDEFGRRKRPSRIVNGNKRDAEKLARELLKQLEEGVDISRGSISF